MYKFDLGKTLMTKGILKTMETDNLFRNEITQAFAKYMNGDWGDTCKEDSEMNDKALTNYDDRIVAVYKTSKGEVFIITEMDRSCTTILFTNEY